MNIDVAMYLGLRAELLKLGFEEELEWAQSVPPIGNAEDFSSEAIWVVCCSGFKAQAARVTQTRVWQQLDAGGTATTVFPRSGKGTAIDKLWKDRQSYFDGYIDLVAADATAEVILKYISAMPYVGGRIIRYHFAKNLGIDCIKPDRWICRLAGLPENGDPEINFSAAMDYCRPLAAATGDRLAKVDMVLWRACNMGILVPN